MVSRGVYIVNFNNTAVTGAITLIQIKAGATSGLEIMKATCSQSNSTTSTMQRIQILRKTAAATVTSFTAILASPNDAAAQAAGGTSATGINATSEGTDGEILVNDVFNYLNGWVYLPIPEERVVVPPSGIIALKLPTAPGASTTFTAQVVFQELC